jgi:hypothetical protein
VSYAITRINDGAGQRAVCNFVGCPTGSQSKYGLDGDVNALNVKRLKKYLSSVFTILGCVERGLGLHIEEAAYSSIGTTLLKNIMS